MSNVAVHSVHRTLAGIWMRRKYNGKGEISFTYQDIIKLLQCLSDNAELVYKLDGLKEIAFIAHTSGDMDWQQEICKQIEELEAQCI